MLANNGRALAAAMSVVVAATVCATAQAQDNGQLEEVVVTGSRIPRAGSDTLEPATVIDEEYIESRGLTNVADALNEIPGFGIPSVRPASRIRSAPARTS